MRVAPFFRNNGLGLACCALTLGSLLGHVIAGRAALNQERNDASVPPVQYVEYLLSGDFLSSLFENWESEFLQMSVFVLLTVWLRQKGSSESKPLDEEPQLNASEIAPDAPWPVRQGGWWRRLYAHSLSIALFVLFVGAFVGHWCGSFRHYVELEALSGRAPDHGLWDHLGSSQFWFESFQNWQSEFFSLAVLVVLTIFLRERDSAQSKAVEASHSHTGGR